MVPKIYDTRRIMRIIGDDDKPHHVTIDPSMPVASKSVQGMDGSTRRIYNPSVGTYDVSVDVGPSYNTKRQEAATAMMEITKSSPELMPLVGDLMVRAMDWPMADQIADRLKSMVPPQALQAEQTVGDEDAKVKAAVEQVNKQAEAQAAQAMQALQAMEQQIQQLQQENQALQAKQSDSQGKLQIEVGKLHAESESLQIEAFRAETERMKAIADAENARIQAMREQEQPEQESEGEDDSSALEPIMQQIQLLQQQIQQMMMMGQQPQAAPVVNVTIEKGGTVRKEIAIQSPSGGVYTGVVEGEE
jgi:hypothetical protein